MPCVTSARAGWAVVQLHPDGRVYKALWGSVPPEWAQTAAVGEYTVFHARATGAVAPGEVRDMVTMGHLFKQSVDRLVLLAPHAQQRRGPLDIGLRAAD